MKALRRTNLLNVEQGILPDETEDVTSVKLSITTTEEERAALLEKICNATSAAQISLATNEYRSGPDIVAKERFRKELLNGLRRGWKDKATEARFMRLVGVLDRDGCAVFAGLIDASRFQQLIDDFSRIMSGDGTVAFLHSFANLIEHPDFLRDRRYNYAFIHPLLIALMAYMMGGPVRMTDVRGKDTQPISVNAQDNMLHIDNTPFREEYKILVGWEKGMPKGPTGQNFTYLPGTHKGNRYIRADETSQPWSTENDSIFVTNETVEGVFKFQKDITGAGPTVVEVEYPDQPISVCFSAGAVVHHRYRTEKGSPRSCVIGAFHLASDNPGALVKSLADKEPQTIADLLIGHQNGSEVEKFYSLLSVEASEIEDKILEILDELHHSKLIDPTSLTLSGDRLTQWREATVNAPSTSSVKFKASNFITYAKDTIPKDLLVKKLTSIMEYDKHGLLDLIIYQDGHEEMRKIARKRVWTMSHEQISQRLIKWLPSFEGYKFSTADVLDPKDLNRKAKVVARRIQESFPTIDFSNGENSSASDLELSSAHQLIIDLGECITRCEKAETYSTTNLFLFWTIDLTLHRLDWALRQELTGIAAIFLRAYIASVLVIEGHYGVGNN